LALSSESSARIDLAGLEEVSDEVDDLLDDSHMVVVAIVANVANEQNHCRIFQILPPMWRSVPFGSDIAGFVRDGFGTISGIFDDLPLRDVDECGTVVMTVPWHDPAGLDHQLAEPQLATFELCRLLFK